VIILSFIFFMALVAALTIFLTRHDDHKTMTGYFLGGRTLSWPYIAFSLLLTNISTEQMVGLNGAAYIDGLSVMAWEIIAIVALIAMALFFLPRFLKYGITTVPQYLEIRFDNQTQIITNVIFLSAYTLILLPIVLYTGATGMMGILDIQQLLGIESRETVLWLVVWVVGITGSLYALRGGLRTVAVSDTVIGVGLLIGGLMIPWFGLSALGEGDVFRGMTELTNRAPERLNSIGGAQDSVPFSTLFTGVLLLHFFYWTTNQQIIQRTFGARSLSEGQKGVVATGVLKLLGPLYLVLPGMIAYVMFPELGNENADQAYGMLVSRVLPAGLVGFFAAVMMGAILSSYSAALNSTCTLFSIGIYKKFINPGASDEQVVRNSNLFGWVLALLTMSTAPLLMQYESIFAYLQKMNGIYFIPIFSVVICGLLFKKVPPIAAKIALLLGITIIVCGYFVSPFTTWVAALHEFHFLGLVFLLLVTIMLAFARFRPLHEAPLAIPERTVDMTQWSKIRPACVLLFLSVLVIYGVFADFSVL
jgi:SSS family solute:Na+ symporter